MFKRLKDKSKFKQIMRFVPIETILNLLKYSKKYLKLLNMNKNCIKYYKILKIVAETGPYNLLDNNYNSYILNKEYNQDNVNCLDAIKNFIFKQFYMQKMELVLEKPEEEPNGDILVNTFKAWNVNTKKNLHLYINSNLILSKNVEKFLFEKVKPSKTFLYLIIEQENRIINKFIKEFKGNIYSLTILPEIKQNVFKKTLTIDDINLVEELNINCNVDKNNRKLLYKDFLPKCKNLKKLSLPDFPQKSEKFGNFLENFKFLEILNIFFKDYKTINDLNSLLPKNNHLKTFKVEFELENVGKDFLDESKLKTFEIDFSFINLLKNMEYFEMEIHEDGIISPKNLIKGLNSIKKLQTIRICMRGTVKFDEFNKLKNPSLIDIDIQFDEYDIKAFIENHKNLKNIKLFYLDDISNNKIKFPEKLEKINLDLSNDKILIQLFKQIQSKPLPFLELYFRVEWLMGRITNNAFNEMAKCFKYLPKLKKLVIRGIGESNNKKRNSEWIKNLKFLKNLNYFELMYYDLTFEELELFFESVQNLEYLLEIKFYDNSFNQNKVLNLLGMYKLPPILKKFNILSQCYEEGNENLSDEEESEESGEEETKYKGKSKKKIDKKKSKKTKKNKIEKKVEIKITEITNQLKETRNNYGYPIL